MRRHYAGHIIRAGVVGDDAVGNLETGRLAEVLDAVGQFAGQSFVGQFRRDGGVHRHHIPGLQVGRVAVDRHYRSAVIPGGAAGPVINVLAGVHRLQFPDVQLLEDLRAHLLNVGPFGRRAGADGNGGQGLAHLEAGLAAGGAAHAGHAHRQTGGVHQGAVHQGFVGHGVMGQVDAVGGAGAVGQFQVAVHLLGYKGRQGGHQPGQGGQAAVEGGVGAQLVGVVFGFPEAAAGTPDIPVGEDVDEFLDAAAGVGGVVAVQMAVHDLYQLVEFGQDPAIQLRFGAPAGGDLGRLEFVNVGVVGKEGIDIPEGEQHLPEGLLHQAVGEAAGFAGGRGGEQAPAQGVGAVGVQQGHRLHDVAQPFAHLAPAPVQNQAQADDIAISDIIVEQRSQGVQAVEPAPGLVHGFADVVGGQASVAADGLVLKGVMELGVGHHAGVKPAVHYLADTPHSPATTTGVYPRVCGGICTGSRK